mmetsp:Transcript_5202/g.9566  ORF Transcript_5202/g.9566 Transcript_5202/m.9566 type:complete len:285 (+) Transcript_5202:717-1571(+)
MLTFSEGSKPFQGKTYRSVSQLAVTAWFHIISVSSTSGWCELIRLRTSLTDCCGYGGRLPLMMYTESQSPTLTHYFHNPNENDSTGVQTGKDKAITGSAIGKWLFAGAYYNHANYQTIHCIFLLDLVEHCSTQTYSFKMWATSGTNPNANILIGNSGNYSCGHNCKFKDIRVYFNTVLTETYFSSIYTHLPSFHTPDCSVWADLYTCSTCSSGFYIDSSQCKPCTEFCKECAGPSPFECTSCSTSQYLHGTVCVATCPTSFTSSSMQCTKTDANLLTRILAMNY